MSMKRITITLPLEVYEKLNKDNVSENIREILSESLSKKSSTIEKSVKTLMSSLPKNKWGYFIDNFKDIATKYIEDIEGKDSKLLDNSTRALLKRSLPRENGVKFNSIRDAIALVKRFKEENGSNWKILQLEDSMGYCYHVTTDNSWRKNEYGELSKEKLAEMESHNL